MSFFDFFFPDQAQASHLRRIADAKDLEAHREGMRRFSEERERRWESVRTQDLEQRVEELERDLGQAGLVIESLIQLMDEKGIATRDQIAGRAIEVDAADGLVDGKITPAGEALRARPFLSRRKWEDGKKPT
ncbi:hypothetical protein [Luteolibacter marinus]|uniref:hypothetical protein n=1 Tax=Luteolibacter marinus TaxID=2776705 RepID=UPI001868E3FD|nr:hypothetical protein [Luteolibacter marinus]